MIIEGVTRVLRLCGVPRFDGDSAGKLLIEIVILKINK